jgi:leader peptidase (prepilin peptidase)/N-methyltransferase
LIGGGIYYAVIQGYARVMGGEGMGGGDVKLAAMLGAFLGWKLYLFAFVVSSLLGGVVGIALMASGRHGGKHPVPFGPFLATGGVVALLWGERILSWYLSVFFVE